MSRLLIPNTCQVPNILLDEVIPGLSAGSVRVLLAIVRLTYGYGKQSDRISHGRLAKITGLSRRRVIAGIKALGSLIQITPGKKGIRTWEGANRYALNLNISTGELDAIRGDENVTRDGNVTCDESDQKGRYEVTESSPPQTHIKSKPIKRAKLKTSPRANGSDPRVNEFFSWWDKEFKKRFSAPYVFAKGKDGATVKRLLLSFDLPKLSDLARRLLDSNDSWIQERGGYTIGVFASQINKLISTSSRSRSRKELPA